MEIAPKETWKVQDATKLQCYMTCPRLYFFNYVLGWQGDKPSVHLEHGLAVHKAMECFYPVGRPDFSDDAVARACEAYYTEYRKTFEPEDDEANAPKEPTSTFRALQQYRDFYKDIDKFDVLHSEVAGSVMIDDVRQVFFKQDTICRDDATKRIFSLEHKTGTRFSSQWAMQWSQKMQVGVYSHVMFCMYEPSDVYGIRINGIFVHKEPTMKKDGSYRADAKDNEFHRVPIAKTPQSMQDWWHMTDHWLTQLENDFDQLAEQTDSMDIMTAFPKNTESCDKWYGCPMAPYCSAWLNPLQHCEVPPLGFVERHWDPRERMKDSKEVVEL